MKVFGEFWRSPVRWDKLESRPVDNVTAFLDISVSNVAQSHGHRPSGNPERYLCYELPVVSFKCVHKRFQRPLNIFRLEANHGGGITHVLAEMHPYRLGGIYKERVDNGPRSVPTQQGLLFL